MASDVGEELRRKVIERANHRCEYCLLHETDAGFAHQVDHIVSRKHGGTAALENLAYSCVLCNRHKGTDLASIDARSGQLVRLFNPRVDLWSVQFSLSGPIIEPVTPVGQVTAKLLRLNAADRVAERRLLQALRRYPTTTAVAP